jgi:YidC/Oxa1 family membrane protein insertase
MSGFLSIWHDFTHFFTWALQQLAQRYAFLGDHRWAAAIITLTLIVRTLLLPIAIKQIKSMRDTQRLAPEMARLRQKYKNDRQKMTEEVMELYRREGVNPYASCLPLVAQMPVFIAMFRVIRELTTVSKSVTAKLAPLAKAKHITVIALAQQQGLIHRMPFLGLGDLSKPALKTPAGWILLALMTGTQWYSTRQLNPGGTDQQQRMQQLMPLFFVLIMVRFPSALVLYWTTQTLYQFVQQNVMLRGWNPRKWFAKPEKVVPAKAGRPASAPAPLPERPAASAAPVPAAQSFGSAVGLGSPVVRRDLSDKSDKRKRRRKKKRKRR